MEAKHIDKSAFCKQHGAAKQKQTDSLLCIAVQLAAIGYMAFPQGFTVYLRDSTGTAPEGTGQVYVCTDSGGESVIGPTSL